MSGIVGSLFNHRGSGIIAKLGTDGHTFNSGGAGKKALTEAVVVVADGVDGSKLADDAVDSEHYTDGSIDNAHIADDAIDSEHYAAGSIDNAHLADDAVDSDELAAGSVDTAHIADNQVTLAKMAGLARGKIIYGDSSGDPAALAVGSADEVLTHDGTDISWASAGGGDLNFGGDTFGADKVIGSNDDYDMTFETNNTARLNLTNGGHLLTGGETDGGTETSAGGICIDTNGQDRGFLTWKNSDVTHGFTGEVEADTLLEIRKLDLPTGGVAIKGYGGDLQTGLALYSACSGTGDTTLTASGNGLMNILVSKLSGDATALCSSTELLFTVKDYNQVRFIVRADGNLYYDGTTNATHWDEHEDANMVRSLDLALAKNNGIDTVDSKFDKFVKYNHETLADLEITGRDHDGKPNNFIGITKLQRLHNGAIRQQYEKHQQLLGAVYDLAKEAVGEEKANAILEKHEVKLLN